MNELALFAGAGGGILGGLLCGWRTVCAVEIDEYCRRVLMQRQDDGILDPFPIWDDVTTFDGHEWRGLVDVVSAGFPCQPFSVAGKQRAVDDSRNGWPATARILGEVRAPWVLLENVPGLISTGYLLTVVGDLAALGYVGRYGILSAAAVGAPHRRERLWIVAHAISDQLRDEPGGIGGASREVAPESRDDGEARDVADAQELRSPDRDVKPLQGRAEHGRPSVESERCGIALADSSEPRLEGQRQGLPRQGRWWSTKPDVGRTLDGLAS